MISSTQVFGTPPGPRERLSLSGTSSTCIADLSCFLFADHRPHATEVDLSNSIPERADLRQLRTQAKELLRALELGETLDDGVRLVAPKLADAQRILARQYGYPSWPKLIDAIETPLVIEAFRTAIEEGDAGALENLLVEKAAARKAVNEPLFSFEMQAIVRASGHPAATKLVPILVRYGADPNIRSKWWAGGFGALDFAQPSAVDLLVESGAKFDAFSAARHGRLDVLRDLLDKDPASVNMAGGDGQRPLHVAANAETAELLISRGADLEIRDVDHESTPIQYQINNQEVVRVLLSHGAKPDIFTAVALNDADLAAQVLASEPSAINDRIGTAPFATKDSNGGHIYAYQVGGQRTPYLFAIERQSDAVREVLQKHLGEAPRLIAAAWEEDRATVEEILSSHPDVKKELVSESRAIADAAQAGRIETVRLLLLAGIDPMSTGMDSGSALHTACWFGHVDIVELLIDKVPLEMRDQVHGSAPLGWAVHGSHWCHNAKGDYPKVVEMLLEAGADVSAPANRNGDSILKQAGKREDVKEVLRRYGAK